MLNGLKDISIEWEETNKDKKEIKKDKKEKNKNKKRKKPEKKLLLILIWKISKLVLNC